VSQDILRYVDAPFKKKKKKEEIFVFLSPLRVFCKAWISSFFGGID
jgi:hypothetical protein